MKNIKIVIDYIVAVQIEKDWFKTKRLIEKL